MDPIDLNLSPSCTNCLAWSSDGILAIAAGDYTTLLVPRSSIRELVRNPGSSETLPEPFYSVKIRTNQFTYREWPIQDPLSYKNFSLGEEQSTCKVAALGWSPKGLGKHRRCVLGVLTSNCVLSLWEAEGHPRELGSWGRAGMVNDALRGYFETVLGGDEDVDKEDIEELKRKKRRIRAFDWSPVLYGESYDPFQHHGRLRPRYFDPPWRIRDSLEPPEISKDTDDDRKWGIFYLTITNDDNDIVFARVCREVRMADHDATIRVDIISHLHMATSPRMPQLQPEYWLSNILDTPHHIRRVSWGPWNHIHRSRDKTYCSVSLIAFLHGNTLHFCRVNLTEERQVKWSNVGKNVLKLDAEFVRFVHKTIDLSSMAFESTLLWCDNDTDIYSAPKKNSTGEEEEEEDDDDDMDATILHYHLAVTSGDSITLISFASNIYRHSHELSERCNFCRMEDNTPVEPRHLDITQQDLTGKQSGHGNFQKVLWEQAIGIAFTKGPFNNEDQLLHMATSSSCAEVIKITKCVDNELERDLVFCPSDEADWIHLIRNEKDRFDRDHDLGGLALAKVWGLASIGHWIAACITLHPGDMVEYMTAADERAYIIMASMIKEADDMIPWARKECALALYPFAPNYKGPDYSLLTEQTKRGNEKVVQWTICSVGPDTNVSHDRLSRQIVRAAWHDIQMFKDHNFNSPSEILENPYEIPKDAIRSSIEWLVPENDSLIARGAISSSDLPELQEQCIICDASIPWTVGTAQCGGGHLFMIALARCSLTTLAIQEPGMSKWCSLCDREFLNESTFYLNLKDQEDDASRENQTAMEVDVDEAGNGFAESTTHKVHESRLSPNSLFWKLFKFFDTCPYCQAHYYTE